MPFDPSQPFEVIPPSGGFDPTQPFEVLPAAEPPKETAPAEAGPSAEAPMSGLEASNRGVLQGLTFGFGDELMAGALTPIEMAVRAAKGEDWSPGVSYDAALKREREGDKKARSDSPVATTVGDVAGSLVTGGGLAKNGITLLNTAKPTAANLIARGAGEGALYGAARGAGEGEGAADRLEEAAYGSGVGALMGGTLGAFAARSANKAARNLLPDIEALKQRSQQAYDAARDAGLTVSPDGVARLGKVVQGALKDIGYHPKVQPKVAAVLDEIEALGTRPSSLQDLESLRRIAGNVRQSTDPSEAMIGGVLTDKIDNFLTSLTRKDVLAGNPKVVTPLLREARTNWGRYRRLENVERAVEKAENRAASTGSGANRENAIRQNIRSILDKGAKGYTAEEKAAMLRVVRGGPVENAARLLGKFAPTGIVSSALSGGAGAAAAGVPGAVALPAAGFAGKKLAEHLADKNVQRLMDTIRSGGKLPPPEKLSPKQLQAIEALLQSFVQQGARALSTAPVGTSP